MPLLDETLRRCEWAREQLDAYVDDELAPLERAAVDGHLAICAACREELAALQEFTHSLSQALPRWGCPPAVSAAALALARQETEAGPNEARVLPFAAPHPPPDRRLRRAWLALAASAAGLAIALGYLTLAPSSPSTPSPSPAELAQARQEARLVLAKLASIGGAAGLAVRDDIVGARILEPTRQALGYAVAPRGVAEVAP